MSWSVVYTPTYFTSTFTRPRVAMLRRIVVAWDDLQVELHGRYSVKRMYAFDAYARHSGIIHIVIVMILTPLPCLAAVALADSIPLEPLSRGLAHSHGLWVRYVFAVWIYSICAVEQLRHFIPGLPLSSLVEFVVPILASVISIAITYGLTLAIGFPLPFTIQLTCVPWGIILSSLIWYVLRTYIQHHPRVVRKLLQFLIVLSCEISLAIVYPAYNAAFVQLSSGSQTAFTLLLPFIKLFENNLIGLALRGTDDMKPEIIVFNVELFNALFVACCMQNAKSYGTNAVLMVVDFIQAFIGLRDLNLMMAENAELSQKLGLREGEMLDAAMAIARANPTSEQLVEQEVKSERQRRSHRRSLLLSSNGLSSIAGFLVPASTQVAGVAPAPLESISPTSATPTSKHVAESIAASSPSSAWAASYGHSIVRSSDAAGTFPIHLLSPKEQRFFLLKTLQVLHLVEFLLLIEFTEVMIPIVYTLYLLILFQLPNREFYPQLKDMDEDRLRGTIIAVMMNATLELCSIVILSFILWKKLRLSSSKQLAFVLETQSRDIQSKVILWTVVSLQCSLVHLGTDYTFRFKWLRGN